MWRNAKCPREVRSEFAKFYDWSLSTPLRLWLSSSRDKQTCEIMIFVKSNQLVWRMCCHLSRVALERFSLKLFYLADRRVGSYLIQDKTINWTFSFVALCWHSVQCITPPRTSRTRSRMFQSRVDLDLSSENKLFWVNGGGRGKAISTPWQRIAGRVGLPRIKFTLAC